MKENKITKITLKTILMDILFLSPVLLSIIFPNNTYVSNICYLYIPLSICFFIGTLAVQSSSDAKEKLYGKDRTKSYDIYDAATDIALVVLLASSGFIFSAGVYMVGFIIIYGIKLEMRKQREEAKTIKLKKTKKTKKNV